MSCSVWVLEVGSFISQLVLSPLTSNLQPRAIANLDEKSTRTPSSYTVCAAPRTCCCSPSTRPLCLLSGDDDDGCDECASSFGCGSSSRSDFCDATTATTSANTTPTTTRCRFHDYQRASKATTRHVARQIQSPVARRVSEYLCETGMPTPADPEFLFLRLEQVGLSSTLSALPPSESHGSKHFRCQHAICDSCLIHLHHSLSTNNVCAGSRAHGGSWWHRLRATQEPCAYRLRRNSHRRP